MGGQVLFEENASVRGFSYASSANSGITFCDFNKDGWDDITVPSVAGDPIRFFQNIQGDFEEVFLEINDPLVRTKQIVWIDFDNDGDKDLFATSEFSSNALYENNDFEFTDITTSAGLPTENVYTNGGSWADYDNDGDLDLFLANRDSLFETPNMLYRNNGDGTFTNVNIISGIGNESTLCFQGTFFDYNNDGWLDLFLINDRTITENILYQNNGNGTFVDVSEQSGSNLVMDAMSIGIEDYDNDGDIDVYITNTFDIDREIKGNVLMSNNGDGSFEDIATDTGTRFDDTSWGANWLDGDNNGQLDLYVSGSSDENSDSSRSSAFYYYNNQAFNLIEDSGFENDLSFSYGNAIGDFNNDGYTDVLVLNQAPYQCALFENKSDELLSNNWLKIALEGVQSNKDGYGAKIEIGTSQGIQYRFRASIESYLSQNSDTEMFGLNKSNNVDYVQVTWPSGQIDLYSDLEVNTTYKIVEGQEILSTNVLTVEENLTIFPNPVKNILSVKIHPSNIDGTLTIYDMLGKKIGLYILSGLNSQINLELLTKGFYVGEFTKGTKNLRIKILKE